MRPALSLFLTLVCFSRLAPCDTSDISRAEAGTGGRVRGIKVLLQRHSVNWV